MAQQYKASLTFSTPFFLNFVFRADFLHIQTKSVPILAIFSGARMGNHEPQQPRL
jgi:hypothetical protein